MVSAQHTTTPEYVKLKVADVERGNRAVGDHTRSAFDVQLKQEMKNIKPSVTILTRSSGGDDAAVDAAASECPLPSPLLGAAPADEDCAMMEQCLCRCFRSRSCLEQAGSCPRTRCCCGEVVVCSKENRHPASARCEHLKIGDDACSKEQCP